MSAFTGLIRVARWSASLFVFAVLVVACGGDDDAPAPSVQTVHPPSISNLRYTPTATLQVAGGSVTITGTFDFTDAGGDIASVRIASSGGADATTTTPQLQGVSAGTVVGEVIVSIDKVGKYTFEVWVSDSRGTASNKLTGTFEVMAQPVLPTDHAPAIVSLRTSPSFVYQALGQTQVVKASVDFVDSGGDLVAFRLVGSWGVDQLEPIPELNGVASGIATFQFSVPIDQAVTHTIGVWAVDGRGAVSNQLAGTVQVLASNPAEHMPTIANLRYAPVSAFQNIGGTVAVQCTLEFADALGDVMAIRLLTSGGADLTAATPGLRGSKSGTATAAFAVPASQTGKFTFEVWAIDDKGSASNRLSGTFNVLPPDTWTTSTSPGVLNAIAFSSGRYVAVGAGGLVASSPDANAWTSQSVGSSSLYSIAGGGSRFAAVGQNGTGQALVITSIDGGAWSPVYQATTPSVLFKVVWAGTRFIAVRQERSSDGKLYALIVTSTDGLTWTRSPQVIEVGDFGLNPRGLTSVASSGSVHVAIGLNPDWEPVAWRSTDAMTWEGPVVIRDAIWAFAMSDITYGGGWFVAVNSLPDWYGDSPVLLSTDGVTWRADTVLTNLPGMNAVASGPGGYLAAGPEYRLSSGDGLTWMPSPMTGCGNGITWDGSRFIAVGASVCKSP
jgi:hypothetical protein